MTSCCGPTVDELTREYTLGYVLGKGKFAVVRACRHKATGEAFAVKMIFKQAVSRLQSIELHSEVDILKRLNHPNIIKLHNVFDTPTHLHIVIELATGGELFDRIIHRGHYSECDAAELVMQVGSALQYIHAHGVTHRDLKPENLLYANALPNAPIKITDFGLAKLHMDGDSVMTTSVGTPGYAAPEVISGKDYGPEVDVWSLGVILYILLCGYPPFVEDDTPSLFRKIMRAEFDFPSPGVWDQISNEAKGVVRSMLVLDRAKRCTVAQLLQAPWVRMETTPKAHLPTTVSGLLVFQNAQPPRLRTAGMSVIATERMKRGSVVERLAALRNSVRRSTRHSTRAAYETVSSLAAAPAGTSSPGDEGGRTGDGRCGPGEHVDDGLSTDIA